MRVGNIDVWITDDTEIKQNGWFHSVVIGHGYSPQNQVTLQFSDLRHPETIDGLIEELQILKGRKWPELG